MTHDEFTASMDLIVTAASLLQLLDLDTMAETCARAESIGPILMPTEFSDGMERLDRNSRAIAAARRFRAAMQDVAGVTS